MAGIPFLTTMGVAAAVGVGIAVLIALTLLPALLGFAGERLRPKPRKERAAKTAARPVEEPKQKQPRTPFPRLWVRAVTKVPLLTVLIVVVGLGALAYPAKDLRIALPSNGMAESGNAGAGDVRPDRRALRRRLQRTADRQRHHRRLRRPARGDGRDRRRAAGPAGRGQRAAVDTQRERRGRHRAGDPDRRAGLRRDQGPRAADPLDAGSLRGRVRRTGLRDRLHRRRHRRVRPARRRPCCRSASWSSACRSCC